MTKSSSPASISQPRRLGVLGDGQLARMMAPAALELGIELHVLAASADSSAAAVIPHTTLGDYRSVADVLAFAEGLDAVTFDHEHVPSDVLAALEATDIAVEPGSAALVYAQDKIRMREAMDRIGLQQPRWRAVSTVEELVAAGDLLGWPLVLKTPRGGYDGKGVRIIDDAASAPAAQDWFDHAQEQHTPLLAEQKMPFTRELSAQVARRRSGAMAAYPIVESIQTDGVCDEVIAPAPRTSTAHHREAERVAQVIAEELDVTGMLAVELFEVSETSAGSQLEPGIYINELAMRPHNSGHWSIDAAVTSQFEQHIRAVLNLPLGSTELTGGLGGFAVMKNILGGANQNLSAAVEPAMRRSATSKIHLYGKEPRPGRKVGHVTVLSQTSNASESHDAAQKRLQRTRQSAATVARTLAEGEDAL